MQPQESRYPADWLRLAERDLARVERSLADNDPSLAGFCLQQAVEKGLKSFLLLHGRPLRRIHDLEALLDDALMHDPELEPFRPACQAITSYYMLERYPLLHTDEVTTEDVRTQLVAVLPLIERIRHSHASSSPDAGGEGR